MALLGGEMPNKYSYSHVIADLGRRGVIQSSQEYDAPQDEDQFYDHQYDGEGDAYTIAAQPFGASSMNRPQTGRQSPPYYTPPSRSSPPPTVRNQYANMDYVRSYDWSQEPGQNQYPYPRDSTSPIGYQQSTQRQDTDARTFAPQDSNLWPARSQHVNRGNTRDYDWSQEPTQNRYVHERHMASPNGYQLRTRDQYMEEANYAPRPSSQRSAQNQHTEARNFHPDGNQPRVQDRYRNEPDFAPSDEAQWAAQDQYAGERKSVTQEGDNPSPQTNVNSHRRDINLDRTRSSDAESLRSSVASVQTVLYDPSIQRQRSLVDQTGTSIYADDDNGLHNSQPSASLSSWTSETRDPIQTSRHSNLSPGPSVSTNSDEGPPSHGSHSTQPSLSHSSGSSHPSDSTEPTPLSMHDTHPNLPEHDEQVERKQYVGQGTLSTGNEGQISEFSMEPPPQNRPSKGKGILKPTRYTDPGENQDLEVAHQRQPPARNPLRDYRQARSGSPSDAHVSRVLRSSRLPPRPEEPRDVRRLDGVEMAEGTCLATQNTDGTDVPVMEAEEVNDLPPPPEAQEGPGLAATDTGPSLGLQRPNDRLRAASPPPPPNFSRNEVRKIAPRASNQGRSLAQEHFTGTSKNPATNIKDHIDAIAQEFQQKLHGRPKTQEEKPFDIIPEPEFKAAGNLPESAIVGPSKDQYWAQPSIWDELQEDESMTSERQEQLIQALRGQRPTEHDLPMGEPHIESSDPTERLFGFDEEDLVDSAVYERDLSSLKAEQILGIVPKPGKDAPNKRSTTRGFGDVVKKFLPGQHAHDSENRRSTDSKTTETSSDIRSNSIGQSLQHEDVDQASIASRDTGDALPPPIRR